MIKREYCSNKHAVHRAASPVSKPVLWLPLSDAHKMKSYRWLSMLKCWPTWGTPHELKRSIFREFSATHLVERAGQMLPPTCLSPMTCSAAIPPAWCLNLYQEEASSPSALLCTSFYLNLWHLHFLPLLGAHSILSSLHFLKDSLKNISLWHQSMINAHEKHYILPICFGNSYCI